MTQADARIGRSAERSPGGMRPLPVVVACCILCLLLGAVHAYSVMLVALESLYSASRTMVSLPYSLALVSIAIAVLAGPRIYGVASPATVLALSLLCGAVGLGLAAQASTIWILIGAFGVLFGLSNGLGYGFSLQLAGSVVPGREGLTMGVVTASYALGAAVAAPILGLTVADFGIRGALLGLSASLIVACPLVFLLLRHGKARYETVSRRGGVLPPVWRLWAAYTTAVFSGLMAIGHASGIMFASGSKMVWLAPSALAIGNLLGSLGGGVLGDRWRISRLLSGLATMSCCGLLAMAITGHAWGMALLLGGIGAAYGAIIALFPALIAKQFGQETGPRVYGRVFTGWGLAGLSAPWIAGLLFDGFGTYQVPLLVAASVAFISALLCWRL